MPTTGSNQANSRSNLDSNLNLLQLCLDRNPRYVYTRALHEPCSSYVTVEYSWAFMNWNRIFYTCWRLTYTTWLHTHSVAVSLPLYDSCVVLPFLSQWLLCSYWISALYWLCAICHCCCCVATHPLNMCTCNVPYPPIFTPLLHQIASYINCTRTHIITLHVVIIDLYSQRRKQDTPPHMELHKFIDNFCTCIYIVNCTLFGITKCSFLVLTSCMCEGH